MRRRLTFRRDASQRVGPSGQGAVGAEPGPDHDRSMAAAAAYARPRARHRVWVWALGGVGKNDPTPRVSRTNFQRKEEGS